MAGVMIVDAALVGLAWWSASLLLGGWRVSLLSDNAGDGGRHVITVDVGDRDGDGDRLVVMWVAMVQGPGGGIVVVIVGVRIVIVGS